MTIAEAYLYLFFDSLMGSMLLPPNIAYVYSVMSIFDYQVISILVVASFGSFCGFMINYFFGKILQSVVDQNYAPKNSASPYQMIKRTFLQYYKPFLLAGLIPFYGEVTSLLAGFWNIQAKKLIPIFLIVNLFRYIIKILTIS